MLGLIELLILGSLFVLIYFAIKKVGTAKSPRVSETSQFKKICYITVGSILVGLVLVKSIISINKDPIENKTVKISFPSMEVDDSLKTSRTLIQLFFVDMNSQLLIHYHENINNGNINDCFGEFEYKGFDAKYRVQLFSKVSDLSQKRFNGNHKISMRSPMYSSSSSGSFIFEAKQGYEQLYERKLRGRESFFELIKTSSEKIGVFLICHRLHPDDKLITISKDELLGKIDFSKSKDNETSYVQAEVPFIELMKVMGASSIIILLGAILIARGINKGFAFPVVLFFIVLFIIAIKKYEFSKYKSIALNQDKSLQERKIAIRNAKEMPFFKASAKELEKNLVDL